MQKSKKFIIIILIMVVLCVIAGVLIANFNNNDRVIRMYNNLSNADRFTFSMEEVNSDIKYKMKISQRGKDVDIDMDSDGDRTSTLILNDHAYYISHSEKQYYDYNGENIDGDIILSGLKEAVGKEYIYGKEYIEGKEYYYEEYSNITSFLILLDDYDEEVVKTRFYFDGDDIVYIKNIAKINGKIDDEILKTNLKYEANDSLFEIPEDYSEMEF